MSKFAYAYILLIFVLVIRQLVSECEDSIGLGEGLNPKQ